MIFANVEETARIELSQALKDTKDKKWYLRLKIIDLSSQGFSVPELSIMFDLHAGTIRRGEQILTSGGRVLGVTATGETIAEAIKSGYEGVGRIAFDGAYYRRDIGHRALRR